MLGALWARPVTLIRCIQAPAAAADVSARDQCAPARVDGFLSAGGTGFAMVGSPNVGLDASPVGEWCARAFAGASVVAGRLPFRPGGAHGEYAERALALRMGALVQQVPPYRALRGLQAVVSDGWPDRVARWYASHALLVHPFRIKAAEMRPTAHGWVDIAPGRSTSWSGLRDLF